MWFPPHRRVRLDGAAEGPGLPNAWGPFSAAEHAAKILTGSGSKARLAFDLLPTTAKSRVCPTPTCAQRTPKGSPGPEPLLSAVCDLAHGPHSKMAVWTLGAALPTGTEPAKFPTSAWCLVNSGGTYFGKPWLSGSFSNSCQRPRDGQATRGAGGWTTPQGCPRADARIGDQAAFCGRRNFKRQIFKFGVFGRRDHALSVSDRVAAPYERLEGWGGPAGTGPRGGA